MRRPSNIQDQMIWDHLLELATPDIYRRNPFRILGVPISATPQEIQRELQRRRMRKRLGLDASTQDRGLLSVDPPPTEEDLRTAMERLLSPVDRLLDEIFWFWPVNGGSSHDAALKALESADVDRAEEIWRAQTDTAEDGALAVHNLAVLYHLVALDYEARPEASGQREEWENRLADLWLDAFVHWKHVFECEDFWSIVKSRVRDLDDRQLTTDFVRCVQEKLPVLLLLINARIVCNPAERCYPERSHLHITLLRMTEFGRGFAEEAIREAVKPIRARLNTAAQNARTQWKSKPYKGDEYVRNLYEQARTLLPLVDTILPEEDPTRCSLHDMIAEAMLEGQIAFADKTNDWTESINLLEMAQEIASGEAIRLRLSKNIQILKKNAEHGNDWYAPGYWDLPPEIIEQLEAARGRANAGDYEGAIKELVVVDPKAGYPLRRCLAFSLNHRGWQIAAEAIDEFRKPTRRVQEVLDVIAREGSISVPTPNTPPWLLPVCPCCKRRDYVRWIKGESDGQAFWICERCFEKDNPERERKKRELSRSITEGLQYLLLAAELDGRDRVVREDVDSLKKFAREVGARIPGTNALKKQLTTHKIRGVRQNLAKVPEDSICFFCGNGSADDSCQIVVPMCGDVHTVDLLFEEGFEYHYTDVVVPRCRRCRDEHRELPERLERWHDAREAVADDEHFPREVREVVQAEREAGEAAEHLKRIERAATRARTSLEEAKAIGERCDRCKSDTFWHDYLCRKCDSELFRLGTLSKVCIIVAAILACIAVFTLDHNLGILSRMTHVVAARTNWPTDLVSRLAPAVATGMIPLFVFLVLTGALKLVQWRRRRLLRETRRAKIPEYRDAAVSQAKKWLDRAIRARKDAEQAAAKAAKALQQADAKLRAARQEAIGEFERLHPEPVLATGIKPESEYVEFCRVKELRGRGWGFGHEIKENGAIAATQPVNVTGLVTREIRLPERRIAGTRTGRRRILFLARQATNPEELVECPVCRVKTKAKNLVRHYDEQHKGMYVPGVTLRTGNEPTANAAKAGRPARTSSRASSGSCPRCGFSYKWYGASCGHCGYALEGDGK